MDDGSVEVSDKTPDGRWRNTYLYRRRAANPLHQIWRDHHNAVDAWRLAGKPKTGPVFDAMKASLVPFRNYTPEEVAAALEEVRPSTTVDDLVLRETFTAYIAFLHARAAWRKAGRPREGEVWDRLSGALVLLDDKDTLAGELGRTATMLGESFNAGDHIHTFERGGACAHKGCRSRCPHPIFDGGICITCGCLKPFPGSPDFYELPLGPPQPCLLTSIFPGNPDAGPDPTR